MPVRSFSRSNSSPYSTENYNSVITDDPVKKSAQQASRDKSPPLSQPDLCTNPLQKVLHKGGERLVLEEKGIMSIRGVDQMVFHRLP